MATSPLSTRGKKTTTFNDHDMITAAVQTQLSHISSFDCWLLQQIEAEEDRNGVVSKVKGRLDRYKQWILQTEQASDHVSDDVEPWSMDARIRPGSGPGVEIVVSGPGSDGQLEITAKKGEDVEYMMGDKYLGYMIDVCGAFAEAQTTMLSLLRTVKELDRETSELSQPAEATVQTRIRRLKEYNDMKDIGQQLIGLVAENRGVRVGTLYENGEYGVAADD